MSKRVTKPAYIPKAKLKMVEITDKVSLVLYETGSIQLRYTKGGVVNCMLTPDMIEAIKTAKFKQELDTMQVDAMDLKAAKAAALNPKTISGPVHAVNGGQTDLAALVAAAVAQAMASLQLEARKQA